MDLKNKFRHFSSIRVERGFRKYAINNPTIKGLSMLKILESKELVPFQLIIIFIISVEMVITAIVYNAMV